MTPGALVGRKYRLTRPIGEGAMGVVWAAVNEDTSGEVALKLILRSSEELRQRLRREARAAGKLRHPNVIEIYDIGETVEGDPFLVMPLLTGETLSELLERQRRLDPPVAARIARDVARALAAAHAGQVIHRDLKPANIFLHQEVHADAPIVKVLDFGVSKNLEVTDGLHTVAGGAVGSPAYMSPEQARVDRTLDARADIWSLGVVLFEMLTGVRPFKGDANQLIAQIVTGEIPLVSRFVRIIDPGLVTLVARCLERDRNKRIGSASELAVELDRFVGPGASASGSPSSSAIRVVQMQGQGQDLASLESTAPLTGGQSNVPSAAPSAPAAAPRLPFSSRPDPRVDPATRSPRMDVGGISTAAPSMLDDELDDLAQTTRLGKDVMAAMIAPRAQAPSNPSSAASPRPPPPAPPSSVPRQEAMQPPQRVYATTTPLPVNAQGLSDAPAPQFGSSAPPHAPSADAHRLATTPLPGPWQPAPPPAGVGANAGKSNESGSWPVSAHGTALMLPNPLQAIPAPKFGAPPSQSSSTAPLLTTPTGGGALSSEAATLEAMTSRRKIKTAVIVGCGLGLGVLLAVVAFSSSEPAPAPAATTHSDVAPPAPPAPTAPAPMTSAIASTPTAPASAAPGAQKTPKTQTPPATQKPAAVPLSTTPRATAGTSPPRSTPITPPPSTGAKTQPSGKTITPSPKTSPFSPTKL